jgi:hypothetical protein
MVNNRIWWVGIVSLVVSLALFIMCWNRCPNCYASDLDSTTLVLVIVGSVLAIVGEALSIIYAYKKVVCKMS